MERNPLIVIPSGLDGGVVPDPGESDEAGQPSLVQTWRRAVESGIGCVIVECPEDAAAAADASAEAGAYVYRSAPDPDAKTQNYCTESGAERVAAAVNRFDRFYNHDVIINVHERLPVIAPDLIRALLYPLADLDVDIATLVVPIDAEEAANPDFVKVEIDWYERRRIHVLTASRVGRALDFSRGAPAQGDGPWFRHVPIYAYKRASLDRFVRAEPTLREMEERLEPVRALENGLRVDVVMTADLSP